MGASLGLPFAYVISAKTFMLCNGGGGIVSGAILPPTHSSGVGGPRRRHPPKLQRRNLPHSQLRQPPWLASSFSTSSIFIKDEDGLDPAGIDIPRLPLATTAELVELVSATAVATEQELEAIAVDPTALSKSTFIIRQIAGSLML